MSHKRFGDQITGNPTIWLTVCSGEQQNTKAPFVVEMHLLVIGVFPSEIDNHTVTTSLLLLQKTKWNCETEDNLEKLLCPTVMQNAPTKQISGQRHRIWNIIL